MDSEREITKSYGLKVGQSADSKEISRISEDIFVMIRSKFLLSSKDFNNRDEALDYRTLH